MGFFKRFFLFVFSACGILALLALGLPWFGPFTRGATALMAQPVYYLVVELVTGVALLGLLINLVRALVVKKVDSIVVTDESGSQVSVTRSAISSQATHIIESDGSCYVEKVKVTPRRKGTIDVEMRLTPRRTVDVREKGSELNQALVDGLALICGDRIGNVDIEFLEAGTPDVYGAKSSSEFTYTPSSFSTSSGTDAPATVSYGSGDTYGAYEPDDVAAAFPSFAGASDVAALPEGEE